MLRRLIGALLASALLLPQIAPTSGQARPAYPSVSIGGNVNAVAVQGSLAYIGEGAKLTILDISAPQTPLRLGSIELSGGVVAVKVSGARAYAVTTGWMFIIDVSNPAAPAIISGTALSKAGQSLEVAGSDVYVGISDCCTGSAAPAALQIFDATDPTSPTLRTEFATRDWINAIQAVGPKLYVIHDRYFSILDPSTSPPTVLDTYTSTTLRRPYDMVVAGDYAYVTNNMSLLIVLDLRSAGSIAIADTLGLSSGTHDLAVADNRAYLSTWHTSPGGLQVVDVSVPADIKTLGSFGGVQDTLDIAVAGSVAYLANNTGGLRMFNVSAPAAIAPLGGYGPVTASTALYADGDRVYAAEQSGVFKIVDPSADPRVLGALPEKGYQVRVISDTAYLLAREGLRIVDVADPAAPALLGSYALPPWPVFTPLANNFDIEGSFAYITTITSPTLMVVDVSNPVSPTLRATYASEQDLDSHEIDVRGDKAYLARAGRGLTILDISDLDSISELGHYGSGYTQFAVDGSTAYALQGSSMDVIDVSDPVSPTLQATYALGTSPSPRDIVADQGVAYVATDKISVLDVSDPAQPRLTGTITANLTISSLQLAGDRLYVNEGSNGFRVVTLAEPALAPTVSTAAASGVTASAAVLGGLVSADGGAAVSERGVVYAPAAFSAEPALGQAGVISQTIGQGEGPFSATVAGLQPATAYAVRAFARNAAGLSYGAAATFTTEPYRIFLPLARR